MLKVPSNKKLMHKSNEDFSSKLPISTQWTMFWPASDYMHTCICICNSSKYCEHVNYFFLNPEANNVT